MRADSFLRVVVLWATFTATATAEWETLRDCRLIPNEFNDGDSFHVRASGEEHIFRLYFADTPESSDQVPERLAEQAAEFGVSEAEVMRAGKAAAEFTQRALQRPFTVTTRWQNARGASALPRYYATITTAEGKDLAELLVAAGLARAHGVVADVPRARDMEHYEALERRARRAAVGIFGDGKTAPAGLADAANETEAEPSPKPTPEAQVKSLTGDMFEQLQRESESGMATAQVEIGIPMPAGYEPAPKPKSDPSPPANFAAVGKISLNHASKADLELLPAIGPGLAEAIIRGRPYKSIEQLRLVPGIGPKKFERIKDLVEP